MREHGHTAAELQVAIGILGTVLALGLPRLRAYSTDAQLVGAAQVFEQEFRKARSIAWATGRQTAIRFESQPDGTYLSTYQDGNHNGVLRSDIDRGIDVRVSGPRRLDTGSASVRVAIIPGTPAPPPETGVLDPAEPIRFGRGAMASFTPLGGATSGTFYLAGEGAQAAVRVNGVTGRVRILIYRNGKWREQ